jgi:protein-tyrosine-phosphatase
MRSAGRRLRGWAITALSGLLAALLRSFGSSPAIRRRLHAHAMKALEQPNLLFICHGNINRSAFAAALARRRWPERDVGEAGTRAEPDNPSSAPAIAAAARWRVDLASHRATPLEDALLANDPAVLVFDARNLVELALRRPRALRQTHLLGWISNETGTPVIADPHGGPPAAYEAAFEQIAAALLHEDEHEHRRPVADA